MHVAGVLLECMKEHACILLVLVTRQPASFCQLCCDQKLRHDLQLEWPTILATPRSPTRSRTRYS